MFSPFNFDDEADVGGDWGERQTTSSCFRVANPCGIVATPCGKAISKSKFDARPRVRAILIS